MILDILLDGPDLCGKTSTLRLINKRLNYQHYLSDRGYFCNYIYSKYYGRDITEMWKQKTLEQNNNPNVLYVIFYFEDEQPLQERYDIRGDECHDFSGCWAVNNLYRSEYHLLKNKILVPIKSNDRTPDQVADYVAAEVNKYLSNL